MAIPSGGRTHIVGQCCLKAQSDRRPWTLSHCASGVRSIKKLSRVAAWHGESRYNLGVSFGFEYLLWWGQALINSEGLEESGGFRVCAKDIEVIDMHTSLEWGTRVTSTENLIKWGDLGLPWNQIHGYNAP